MIGVGVLSYRTSEFEFQSDRLANQVVTCCKYHPEKRGSLQTVGYQEDGSHQEIEKEREDCQVAVPVTKAFSGKFEYSSSRKILKYLARVLETNVKRKILSDTSHHKDFSSFDDCRALLFAVAEIRPYAAPHGQVAEYWSKVLTKLQSDGRFPEKERCF